MTKRVLVFDVGVGAQGIEIRWLVDEVFPSVGVTDYEIHGFEACAENFASAEKRIGVLPGVHLHRLAIADREGTCRLYHSVSQDGHSIFATKNNLVDAATRFEDVACSRLSAWIAANVQFPADVNILRFNVEGAEWPLIEDLDKSGLLGNFGIVCGACGGDITIVQELADAGRFRAFLDILDRRQIKQFWFCYDNNHDAMSKQTMRERLLEALAR